MAFLPPNPLDLHGGCFCGAIRYTINVPALEDRPLVPNMLKTPIGSDNMVDTRWPTIELDHCDSCRHAAGAIIQCWLICPAPWISWSLLKRSSNVGPAQSPLPASRNEQSEGREAFSAVDVSHPTGSKKQEALADTYLSSFSTSNTVHRALCGRCGTNLTYYYEREPSDERVPHIDITVGSLDTSSLIATGVRPDRHGWWSDGVEWVQKLLFAGDTTPHSASGRKYECQSVEFWQISNFIPFKSTVCLGARAVILWHVERGTIHAHAFGSLFELREQTLC